LIRRRFVFVLAAVVALPASLRADWRLFLPQSFENGAYVDLFASDEGDDQKGVHGQRWSDRFLKEKLTLFSNGYVYDPRFLAYRLSVSGALKQESYEASNLPPLDRRKEHSLEYDAKVFLLAEHPLNLELFALRYQPLFKERDAIRHDAIESSRGAELRYLNKPYYVSARAAQDEVESEGTTSDVDRLQLNGQYFKEYRNRNRFSLSASLNPTRFTSSNGVNGSTTESLLSSFIDLRRFRLTSSLAKDVFDQRNGSAPAFKSDQLAWYELFTAYLPANFRTDLSYRYQRSNTHIAAVGSSPGRDVTAVGKDVQFDVVHKLYQSLDSTYLLQRNENESQAGNATAVSQSLSLNYTKLIPVGRLLAGVSVGRTEVASEGQAEVADELHPASSVPGSFTLAQSNPVRSSLVVFVRSPVAPFELVRLAEGEHYSVNAVGDKLEVLIFALPLPFAVPGTFDIRASYALVAGRFRLRSDTRAFNASVPLFDNLLTPYVSRTEIRSSVVEGTFNGTGLDSTSSTAGLTFIRWGLQARVEYQNVEWEVNPYYSWREELQYVSALGPTTSLYATASRLSRYFAPGSVELQNGAASDTTETASASIQQQFLLRTLAVSVGGVYSRVRGLTDSNASSANASLSWKIGRLDVNAGASVLSSDSSGVGVVVFRRTHHYYFLKVRRAIF